MSTESAISHTHTLLNLPSKKWASRNNKYFFCFFKAPTYQVATNWDGFGFKSQDHVFLQIQKLVHCVYVATLVVVQHS